MAILVFPSRETMYPIEFKLIQRKLIKIKKFDNFPLNFFENSQYKHFSIL